MIIFLYEKLTREILNVNGIFLLIIAVSFLVGLTVNESFAAKQNVSIPSGTSSPGCETNNSCYLPPNVSINKGDRVDWTNNDFAAHTVTSGTVGNPDGKFDSGLLLAGKSFEHQFNDSGTFPYHCILHPWMKGTVTVSGGSGGGGGSGGSGQGGPGNPNNQLSCEGVRMELDKKIYTWTDKVYITVIAYCRNLDPNALDFIGTSDNPLYVKTSKKSLDRYQLIETGVNTGIFTGEVTLTGFSNHDANGDGFNNDASGTFGGTGPLDGLLPSAEKDSLTITYKPTSGQEIAETAQIQWNLGQISWLEASYPASGTGVVRVIDKDMDLNPNVRDSFEITVISNSDSNGLKVKVTETNEATGIFESSVSFSENPKQLQLKVSPGDTVIAKYTDRTSLDTNNRMAIDDVTANTKISGAGTQQPTPSTVDNPKNVPQWIINNACWWSEGQISDSDFIQTAQYLVSNGFVDGVSSDATISSNVEIPSWLKNNAGWWCTGLISYDDFQAGIQQLVRESQSGSTTNNQIRFYGIHIVDTNNNPTTNIHAGDRVNVLATLEDNSNQKIEFTVALLDNGKLGESRTGGTLGYGFNDLVGSQLLLKTPGIHDIQLYLVKKPSNSIESNPSAFVSYLQNPSNHILPPLHTTLNVQGSPVPSSCGSGNPSISVMTDSGSYFGSQPITISGRYSGSTSPDFIGVLNIVGSIGGSYSSDFQINSDCSFSKTITPNSVNMNIKGSYTAITMYVDLSSSGDALAEGSSTFEYDPDTGASLLEFSYDKDSYDPGEKISYSGRVIGLKSDSAVTYTSVKPDGSLGGLNGASRVSPNNGGTFGGSSQAGNPCEITAGQYTTTVYIDHLSKSASYSIEDIGCNSSGSTNNQQTSNMLSISTDKNSYNAGDTITIRASMSNPSRVAILITDPEDYAVLTRTITPPNTVQFKAPDVAGTYTISATSEVNGITITDTETFVVMQSGSTGATSDASVVIRSVTPIDQQGNPVSSFNKGRTGFVKVVVTADSEVEALVTVNLFDSDLTSLGVGAFKTELQPGTPQEIQMSFFIPDDASSGLGTIFANALSDWPAFEGVPLSDEAESEVIIR